MTREVRDRRASKGEDVEGAGAREGVWGGSDQLSEDFPMNLICKVQVAVKERKYTKRVSSFVHRVINMEEGQLVRGNSGLTDIVQRED